MFHFATILTANTQHCSYGFFSQCLVYVLQIATQGKNNSGF